MASIQVLGLVRFSYACQQGFQIRHDSLQDRLDFLFEPTRIEERFALFQHVTLPAIRAQTDPDFTLVVVTSADIPEVYLDRLANLLDGIAQVALVLGPYEKMRPALSRIMAPFVDQTADAVAHFRLDDDDAVAVDFVQQTRHAFSDCQKEFDTDGKVGLDFDRGIVLCTSTPTLTAKSVMQRQWTPALVVFQKPSSKKTIVHFPHHRLAEFMKVHRSSTQRMFVRGFNQFNDSQSWKDIQKLEPVSEPIQQSLRDRFCIDLNTVESLP